MNAFIDKKYPMETTLVILKPSAVLHGYVGQIVQRFQQKGLVIRGMKMMQLDEKIPFFPDLLKSMMASPVIVMALWGNDAVNVVRMMTGATNGRKAQPGTIRGDFSVSGQENIVHASDSADNAEIELKRFFSPDEIFDYQPSWLKYTYEPAEMK